jgi:nucleoid DNA-binding protein
MKTSLLVEKIARSAEVDETEAKRAINIILSGIVESLRQNSQATLGNFGTFKLVPPESKDQTSKTSLETNNNVLRFIPSAKLRYAINNSEDKNQ